MNFHSGARNLAIRAKRLAVHFGNGIHGDHPLPAKESDLIVQRIVIFPAAEFKFLRPVEDLPLTIIMGVLSPSNQMYLGIACLRALYVLLFFILLDAL
jgi:hypothetical protein